MILPSSQGAVKFSTVKLFVLLIALLGVSACTKRQKLCSQNKIKDYQICKKKFVQVAGIECKFCALAAVRALEAVPGVMCAYYRIPPEKLFNPARSVIEVAIENNNNLNCDVIADRLKQEGLELLSIAGE